jgi:DNA-binding beta-propeller fold protein YncE
MLNSLVLGAALALAAGNAPRFAVIESIPGPDGPYDYIAVDSERQRVFVARKFGVTAVDLEKKTVTRKLVGADDASAVLLIPGTNLMLSTEYGGKTAVLFDRETGKVKNRVKVGKAPDAAAYDPASQLVFVMNTKSNDTTLVSIENGKAQAVATIPLGGRPESAVADGNGLVYVNIEDGAEVAVIDSKDRKVTKRLKLEGCVEPTGIAYDAASGTIISACHNSIARLLDARTGNSRGAVKIGNDADGAIFDSERRLAWIPAADGTLTWFRLETTGRVTIVDSVKTEPGARTAALDAKSGRVYLPVQQEKSEGVLVPGTFRILVVAPAPPTS